MSAQLDLLKKELAEGKAQIFDVRETDEWNDGHLAKASFTPLSELRVGLEPENKDATLKTYLYCRSGNRVHMAKPILESMGYQNVIALQEGFDELVDNGFEAKE
jgi:rhodanese-related sulfurtransferase